MKYEMNLYDREKKGEKRGIKKGRTEERKEIVSSMIKEGLSFETIKKVVPDITDQQLLKLKENLN